MHLTLNSRRNNCQRRRNFIPCGISSQDQLESRVLAVPLFIKLGGTASLFKAAVGTFVPNDTLTPPLYNNQSLSDSNAGLVAFGLGQGSYGMVGQSASGQSANLGIFPTASPPGFPSTGLNGIETMVVQTHNEQGQSFGVSGGPLEVESYAEGLNNLNMVDSDAGVSLQGHVNVDFSFNLDLGGADTFALYEVHYRSPFISFDAVGGTGGGELRVWTTNQGNPIKLITNFGSSGTATASETLVAPVQANFTIQYSSWFYTSYAGPGGEPLVSGTDDQSLEWTVAFVAEP